MSYYTILDAYLHIVKTLKIQNFLSRGIKCIIILQIRCSRHVAPTLEEQMAALVDLVVMEIKLNISLTKSNLCFCFKTNRRTHYKYIQQTLTKDRTIVEETSQTEETDKKRFLLALTPYKQTPPNTCGLKLLSGVTIMQILAKRNIFTLQYNGGNRDVYLSIYIYIYILMQCSTGTMYIIEQ